MYFIKRLYPLILAALLSAGCGGGSSSSVSNLVPVANAGIDQNVITDSNVTLDGSGSTDADGDALTYKWSIVTIPGGSSAILSSTSAVKPTFTADMDGNYTFSLVVNDGKADSAADTVTVMATTGNAAPVADAGPDQYVTTGSTVNLDGNGSTDANGDSLIYSWSFVSKPAGSSASLMNADTAAPSFVADMNGSYTVELIVNDGTVDSAPDTVTVTAVAPDVNIAPVADAGHDQNIKSGMTVTLDGNGSYDADGDPLTYSWNIISKPSGSTATLFNATTVDPTFIADVNGTYIVQLIVNDGTVNSVPDTVSIIATSNSGTPDTAFGGAGFVVSGSAAGGAGDDEGRSIAVDKSGHVYVTGYGFNASGNEDMVIWKYDSNGSLDPTFGSGGIVVSDNAAGGDGSDVGRWIALDDDGNIYVTGYSQGMVSGYYDMVIWKYDSNGTLDTSFGSNGIVVSHNTAGGGQDTYGNSIVLDSGGSIFVSGWSYGTGGDYDMVVWKYDSNGTLDPSFGSGGVVMSDNAAGGNGNDWGISIALDGAGNVYVTGGSYGGVLNNYDMVIWKYDSNGSPDTSFGSNGIVTDNGAAGYAIGEDRGRWIVLDNAGNVYVAGYSMNVDGLHTDMVIWKFDSSGTLDTSFNGDGIVTYPKAYGDAMVRDSAGNIYVTGADTSNLTNYDMITWKYDSNGTLDATFGSGGVVIDNGAAGGNGDDRGHAVVLDDSGSVYVTGYSTNANPDRDMAIWKFQ